MQRRSQRRTLREQFIFFPLFQSRYTAEQRSPNMPKWFGQFFLTPRSRSYELMIWEEGGSPLNGWHMVPTLDHSQTAFLPQVEKSRFQERTSLSSRGTKFASSKGIMIGWVNTSSWD
jgi:hypothetical protein